MSLLWVIPVLIVVVFGGLVYSALYKLLKQYEGVVESHTKMLTQQKRVMTSWLRLEKETAKGILLIYERERELLRDMSKITKEKADMWDRYKNSDAKWDALDEQRERNK